jgi:putative hydrolase of the HAD superfamily
MMAKQYKHIFFDLDHTLWDFETNSNETLIDLVHHFGIDKVKGFDEKHFLAQFHKANFELWDKYNKDLITTEDLRSQRFDMAFASYDFDKAAIKEQFNEQYLLHCPHKGKLMPSAFEVLEKLFSSYYNLYILTNGFEHVQLIKLTTSNIFHFFEEVFTVKDVGYKKPNPDYFKYVLSFIGARPEECIMVGDSIEIDVLGAMQVGIDGVWYNPKNEKHHAMPNFEIAHLEELLDILPQK